MVYFEWTHKVVDHLRQLLLLDEPTAASLSEPAFTAALSLLSLTSELVSFSLVVVLSFLFLPRFYRKPSTMA